MPSHAQFKADAIKSESLVFNLNPDLLASARAARTNVDNGKLRFLNARTLMLILEQRSIQLQLQLRLQPPPPRPEHRLPTVALPKSTCPR